MKKKYLFKFLLLAFLISSSAQAGTFHKPNNDINSIIKLSEFKHLSVLLIQKANTPTAPILSIKKTTETTIDLYWTEALDKLGIAGYKVYKDDVLEATLDNVLSYKVTGVAVGTSHDYKVIAFNTDGIEGTPSNILTIRTGTH